MTLSGIDKRWITLPNLCAKIDENDCISILNDHEFIIATLYNETANDGIHKYNINKNAWIQIWEYPHEEKMQIETMAINRGTEQNKIYLGDCHYKNKRLVMFDTTTNKLSTLKSPWKLKVDSSMVNVNGVFHIIGGYQNSTHVSWNSDNDEFVIMHDFKTNGFNDIFSPSTIYVPSKQMILLIGGLCFVTFKMIGIWKFCLKTNKWHKLEGIQLDYYHACPCLTSNEEYIVIGGGLDKNDNYMNKLYVLDIREDEEYKLKECDIKLPIDKVKHRIVRSGGGIKDEILVVGWIKKQFKDNDLKELSLLPMYMMQLIALWYNQEMIHWFTDHKDAENNHYCIRLKHILSCMKSL